MKTDMIEIKKKFSDRLLYIIFTKYQIMEGITSIIDKKKDTHRILWDLDECTLNDACDALMKVQKRYNLGKIEILSDRENSYGAVCNNIVSFKELMHILIDTEHTETAFINYTFVRHKAILRMTNKEGRTQKRTIICKLYNKSDRPTNETEYNVIPYETGIIKRGIRLGDFRAEQTVKEVI